MLQPSVMCARGNQKLPSASILLTRRDHIEASPAVTSFRVVGQTALEVAFRRRVLNHRFVDRLIQRLAIQLDRDTMQLWSAAGELSASARFGPYEPSASSTDCDVHPRQDLPCSGRVCLEHV